VAPVAYNWTGCYVGGNASVRWANTSGTLNILPGGDLPGDSFDLSGVNSDIGSFIGGGQVGCDYQTGQLVFGIEGNADWQPLSRMVTFVESEGTFNLTSNWQTSLRGRLGYAADRVLWYATGGVAWTRVSSDEISFMSPVTGDLVNIVPFSKTAVGLTAGAGFEYAIADQVTIGLEGRFIWYGSQSFNTLATDIAPVTGSLNLNTAEIIGKINWRFGGGGEPPEPPEPPERRERR